MTLFLLSAMMAKHFLANRCVVISHPPHPPDLRPAKFLYP